MRGSVSAALRLVADGPPLTTKWCELQSVTRPTCCLICAGAPTETAARIRPERERLRIGVIDPPRGRKNRARFMADASRLREVVRGGQRCSASSDTVGNQEAASDLTNFCD